MCQTHISICDIIRWIWGNAACVKLSSLQKLTDIRANKPGMNLIHYVALVSISAVNLLFKYSLMNEKGITFSI